MKIWIDDVAIHTKSEEELISTLRDAFGVCRNYNFKISAVNCKLFLRKLEWCGRIIDAEGIQFDPRKLVDMRSMALPTTAGELCEYIHCLGWMAPSIPSFAQRSASLREVLEKAYRLAGGKRTKRAIAKIPLAKLGWTDQHDNSFRELQA